MARGGGCQLGYRQTGHTADILNRGHIRHCVLVPNDSIVQEGCVNFTQKHLLHAGADVSGPSLSTVPCSLSTGFQRPRNRAGGNPLSSGIPVIIVGEVRDNTLLHRVLHCRRKVQKLNRR